MSDIESNSDNEAEFIKRPKSFQGYNVNHNQGFMNIVTPEQALQANTSKQDAVDSDEMAPRNVAGAVDKMAPQNYAQVNDTLPQHALGKHADILAVRKSAVDAHNMASKNVANNGAQLFKWNVEKADGQMVAPRAAATGGGSATEANVLGGAVPPPYRETARRTTQVKGVANYAIKMADGYGYKMAADTLLNKMTVGYGCKMVDVGGYKLVTCCGKSTPRRGNTGCYDVRMGTHSVRWLQKDTGNMMFTSPSTRRSGYVNARRAAPVRPALWRVTLQALLFMTLAIFLTYFGIRFMENYLH